MDKVLPVVTKLVKRYAERTVFTRFIPPRTPDEATGAWRIYYERWRNVCRDELDTGLLDLAGHLPQAVPPAQVFDKATYSAFASGELRARLQQREADAVVITGLETDSCVAATVYGALDAGLRVVVVRDAICSSSDAGHDGLCTMFEQRFSEQLKVTDSATLLAHWT